MGRSRRGARGRCGRRSLDWPPSDLLRGQRLGQDVLAAGPPAGALPRRAAARGHGHGAGAADPGPGPRRGCLPRLRADRGRLGRGENHGGGPGRVFSVRLEAAPETVLGGLSEGQVELAVLPEFGAATWGKFRPLLSAFQTAAEGMDCLGAAGLSSVPAWLGPHEVLSQGQRYRANLAMLLARRRRAEQRGETIPVGLDEFTSELDRPVAQAVALALRKRIAREGSRGWMLATCNADIIPCLQPEYLVVCRAGQRPLLVRGGASIIGPFLPAWSPSSPRPQRPRTASWASGRQGRTRGLCASASRTHPRTLERMSATTLDGSSS
ncbi:unnamed protein product [Prorocentrum cordatum]|uniref:Uncharacterized protein n=1 Tax=Prorocentrum cordatum TaxID=2364126 RepID=A0ABN9SHB4_9DINO|nr:unnamed protein product [Polarella glacialis]